MAALASLKQEQEVAAAAAEAEALESTATEMERVSRASNIAAIPPQSACERTMLSVISKIPLSQYPLTQCTLSLSKVILLLSVLFLLPTPTVALTGLDHIAKTS